MPQNNTDTPEMLTASEVGFQVLEDLEDCISNRF